MRVVPITTPTHGRVLIRDANASSASPLCVVGFHGYGQSAEDMLAELELIPGNEKWTLVSVQALHRFYARGQRTVASWMTRQDRELAIEDNIAYVNSALATLAPAGKHPPLVFVGFSQGVAMAYRAAVLGAYRGRLVVAVGGDVPPELQTAPAGRFPSVRIAAGESDQWYTSSKVDADVATLQSSGVDVQVFRYPGGHEWTPQLREYVRQMLEESSIEAGFSNS